MKFSGLKDVLKTFDEHGWKGSFTRESWTIGNGGYDCWFELYYKGQPVASCLAGVLESNSYLDVGEKEKLLSKILEVYPHLECSFDFKKPADIKKRLSDQIHAAEDKKQPAAKTNNNSREKPTKGACDLWTICRNSGKT